jgi:hypothetical protein
MNDGLLYAEKCDFHERMTLDELMRGEFDVLGRQKVGIQG